MTRKRERNRLIFITVFVSVEPDGSVCFSEAISRPGEYFVCRFCFPKTEFRMVVGGRQTKFRQSIETGAKISDASSSWSRSSRSQLAAMQFIWYVGWIYWWERVRSCSIACRWQATQRMYVLHELQLYLFINLWVDLFLHLRKKCQTRIMTQRKLATRRARHAKGKTTLRVMIFKILSGWFVATFTQ